MTIVTSRTIMVPYTEEFKGDFIRLNCCPINRVEMNGPHTSKSALNLFDQVLKSTQVAPTSAMAVLDLSSREYIGHVFVTQDESEFELGFIFDKSVWGNGIATEVLLSYVPKVIARQNISHLTATVNTHHLASQKLLDKLGFVVTAEEQDEFGPYFCLEKNAA